MKLLFFIILIQVCVLNQPSTANVTPGSFSEVEENLTVKLDRKCNNKDNSSCMFLKMLSNMNIYMAKPEIPLTPKIEIIKKREDVVPDYEANALNALRNSEPDEVVLIQLMLEKFKSFVRSRALRWKLSDVLDLIFSKEHNGRVKVEMSIDGERVLKEGRGKMKKNGPIIGWIVLKGLLLGILAFKVLAVLSGKALLISKLALLFSSLIGVKNLLHQKDKGHVTYEIAGHRSDNLANVYNKKGLAGAIEYAADTFYNGY